MRYIPRIVDSQVEEALQYAGGIVIEGVRGCGKTRTGARHAQSSVELDSDDPQIAAALEVSPALLLDGASPRLVDEWQLQPELWNVARRRIDRSDSKGLFIFTGSSTPDDDPKRHSGAHRFTRIRMKPMTLIEREIAQPRASLRELFATNGSDDAIDPTLEVCDLGQVLDAIAHGGWPADLKISTDQALVFIRDYLDHVIHIDLARLLDGLEKDPDRMNLVLRSLARNVATEVNYSTIQADIARARPISRNTVSQYISVLERLFLVERQYAWAGRVRSKAALRTSEKLHFADPAVACAMLGLNASGLMQDLNTAGFIFESAVYHQLSVLVQPLHGTVQHYRDKAGREVDMIVTLPDGRWAAIEVKLGSAAIPAAEKSLEEFVANVDTDVIGKPAFTAVITANGGCMRLPSGAFALNIAALGQ